MKNHISLPTRSRSRGRGRRGGRLAMVTGAAGGVGRAVAMALATAGFTVGLVGRQKSLAHLERLNWPPKTARVNLPADLALDADVSEVIGWVREQWGRLDVLVHCAGVISLARIEDGQVSDFDRMYQVNVRAPFLLTQGLLPCLRKSRGQIVFINSSAGLSSTPGLAQYCATKHALRALADVLRQEENRNGVRVLSLFLGRTATPMQRRVHRVEGRPYSAKDLITPRQVAAVVRQALEHRRQAEITDLHFRPMAPPPERER